MVYAIFLCIPLCFMKRDYTLEQQDAINKRDSNILVSASAGSGKTAVLIERVTNRVILDEIDIDKILVVTFTNAAALELKDRLKKSLDESFNKNKEKRDFIKRQLKLLNRASISTLHAFCLKIIRENFETLEIDPDFKIADESENYNLKIKALNEVFENEYKDNSKELIKVLQLFNYKEEDLFTEILNIYSYIKCFPDSFKFLENGIEKYNLDLNEDLYELDFGKEIYKDVISRLNLLSKKLEEKIDSLKLLDDFSKINEILITDKLFIDEVLEKSNNSWDKLYENLNCINFKNMPKYSGNNIELKEEIANFRKNIMKAEIIKCKKIISSDSKNIIKDNLVAYKYLKYLLYILKEFENKYYSLKIDKNLIDFSDVEHMMYKLLYNEDGSVTELSKTLKEYFNEVYTDEYQDISLIQEEILNGLSKENNRFMVGDTKQSIYRFRGASPEIFNNKLERYKYIKDLKNNKEDTKILLSKNFRSRDEVLKFANLVFENIMSMEAGGCNYTLDETLKYGASFKNKSDEYISELNVINLKKDDEDIIEKNNSDEEDIISELKDFEIEAYYVAKRIKSLVGIFDIEEKENIRKAKFSDIVILLRNVTGKAKILEDVFKKVGIPVFCDVSSSIFDTEEVDLLLSFLKLIDNKYQDIYLVSVMYSVIGGFNLDEIVKIKNNKKTSYFYELLEDYKENGEDIKLKEKVSSFIEKLNYYISFAKRNTVSEIINNIYHNTGIYYQFILDKEGKARCANLDLILQIALEFEKTNLSNVSEFISYVDSLKNKLDSLSMSAKSVGENEDVVRVMTIHKSKGLEFPIVMLCDTARKYNYKDLNNKVLLDRNLGIGINVVNEDYNVSYPSIIKQAIKYNIIKELKSEELRILYVALTRAKEKLIMFGTTKDYSKLYDSIFVMKKDGKVDPFVVLQNDSYLTNIILALKASESYKDKLKFSLIKENLKDEISQDEKKEFNKLSEKIDSIKNNYDENIINEKLNKIKEEVSKYQNKNNNEKLSRVSVSELKKENKEIQFELPNCISNNTYMSSARKGTLVHFILQLLDFSKINTKKELEDFINECELREIIDSKDKKAINLNNIMNFLNSNIGNMLKKSKYIRKEEEFILRNSSFSKSVIQGVIDLYFFDENDRLILVDFKTDNIDDENEFIKRYEKQLLIYKEALEKLLKKKVYKTYIYSFKLNKEIELGEEYEV